MALGFRKATNANRKIRMALMGVSGSGKTMSALEIASAIGQKVALIDSEKGSSEHYSGRFSFDICDLGDDTHPANYIEAISIAEQSGYDFIIVDSLSHAWLTELDIVSGQFGNWNKVRPIERQLIRKIIGCKSHILCTMRVKTEWTQEEYTAKNGQTKSAPKRVGTSAVQSQGIEYEYDIIGNLDLEHVMSIEKTRFADLDGKIYVKPGKRFAQELMQSLHSSKTDAPEPEEENLIVAPSKVIQIPTNGNGKKVEPKQAEKIDREKWMKISNDELQRLGWTAEQGRNHLIKEYNQRSRHVLSDTQLVEFCTYLSEQPTPVVKVSKVTSEQKRYLDAIAETLSVSSQKLDKILEAYPDGVAIKNDDLLNVVYELVILHAKDYVMITDHEVFDNDDCVVMTRSQVIEKFEEMTAKNSYSLASIKTWIDYIENVETQEEAETPTDEEVAESEAIAQAETEGETEEKGSIITDEQYNYFHCVLEDFGIDEEVLDKELSTYTSDLSDDDVKGITETLAYHYLNEIFELTVDEIVPHFQANVALEGNIYSLQSIRDWSVNAARNGIGSDGSLFSSLSVENRVYFKSIIDCLQIPLTFFEDSLEDVNIDDDGSIPDPQMAYLIKLLAKTYADNCNIEWDAKQDDIYNKQVVMKNHSLSALKIWTGKMKSVVKA